MTQDILSGAARPTSRRRAGGNIDPSRVAVIALSILLALLEGLLWSPMSFLLLASVFRASNSDYEEAAQMSGASVLTTLWRISMRLALPAVAAVGLLVVIRSIEAFEVPALVGLPGKVRL